MVLLALGAICAEHADSRAAWRARLRTELFNAVIGVVMSDRVVKGMRVVVLLEGVWRLLAIALFTDFKVRAQATVLIAWAYFH